MSYTKFSKEITKWLKEKELPVSGKSSDTLEETERRLSAWQEGTKVVFEKWLSEKRYKELISCAHGGWYKESEFFEPLAEYFIKEKELQCLKILCERKIRFETEDMLKLIKSGQDDGITITPAIILGFDTDTYNSENAYNSVGEVAKYRQKVLKRLGNYIVYLEKINMDNEYFETIKAIRDKVFNLSIQKSDLKCIKNKI